MIFFYVKETLRQNIDLEKEMMASDYYGQLEEGRWQELLGAPYSVPLCTETFGPAIWYSYRLVVKRYDHLASGVRLPGFCQLAELSSLLGAWGLSLGECQRGQIIFAPAVWGSRLVCGLHYKTALCHTWVWWETIKNTTSPDAGQAQLPVWFFGRYLYSDRVIILQGFLMLNFRFLRN